MQKNSIVDKIEKLIKPTIESLGCELWGCEVHLNSKHALLRIYIDSQNGIGLEDCSKVSQAVSAILDVEDPIASAYSLEVSSPGLKRLLFKPEHFKRFIGSQIKLRLMAPENGRRNYSGYIKSVENNNVIIKLNDIEVLEIPVDRIEKANLM